MIFNNPIYLKNIAFSVLIIYELLFFTSIAHYHHIELNSENSFKVSNNFDTNNHFSNYSDLNCPIYHYFNSLHSIINQCSNICKISLPEILLKNFGSNPYYKFHLYNSSQLRGPPIVIS